MLQVLIGFSKPSAEGTRGASSSRVSAVCAVLCCRSAQEQSLWMVKGTFNEKNNHLAHAFLRTWVATGVIALMELERCCATVVFIFMWCSLWLLFYCSWVHYYISQLELNTPEPWGCLQLLPLTEQTGARKLSRCYSGCI